MNPTHFNPAWIAVALTLLTTLIGIGIWIGTYRGAKERADLAALVARVNMTVETLATSVERLTELAQRVPVIESQATALAERVEGNHRRMHDLREELGDRHLALEARVVARETWGNAKSAEYGERLAVIEHALFQKRPEAHA